MSLILVLPLKVAQAADDPLKPRWDAFIAARNDGRQTEARQILDELVAKGYPRAQARLAQVLRAGDAWYGAGTDYPRAFALFEKAWAGGNPSGAHGIGYMYYEGEGRPKDYEQAVAWFRKAADAGLDASHFMLGVTAFKGRGMAQDCAAAENHYIKAIELGSDTAKYNLGWLYDKGCPGFPPQPDRALHWMRESAKTGDDDAKAYVAKREAAAAAQVAQPRALGQMEGGGPAMDKLFRGALLAAAEMGFKAGEIDNEGRTASLFRSYQGHEVRFVLRVPPRGNTVNGQMMVRDDDVRTGFIKLYRQELAKQVGTSIELDGNISGR